MPVISILLLALAVSLDSFGAGVMYGLRKIRISPLAIAIIAFCSGLVIFAAMQIGVLLSAFVAPWLARLLGAVILIGIGIWAIVQAVMQKRQVKEAGSDMAGGRNGATGIQAKDGTNQTILRFELKKLGLVIQILRSPSAADVDRSGAISPTEATFLGIALSLDAFGAGIGAALIGFSPLATAVLIALSSGLFITFGLRIGYVYSGMAWMRRMAFVPGCLLIAMGILKML